MDTKHYQTLLEEKRAELERELSVLGKPAPEGGDGWVLSPVDLDIMEADRNEAADRTEEIQADQAVLDNLELQYKLVLHALDKIEKGTYGTCEISGDPIEEDRLSANPTARTSKAHMEEEGTLSL